MSDHEFEPHPQTGVCVVCLRSGCKGPGELGIRIDGIPELTIETYERDRRAFYRYMGDRTLNATEAREKYLADPDRLPRERGHYGEVAIGYLADTNGFEGSKH